MIIDTQPKIYLSMSFDVYMIRHCVTDCLLNWPMYGQNLVVLSQMASEIKKTWKFSALSNNTCNISQSVIHSFTTEMNHADRLLWLNFNYKVLHITVITHKRFNVGKSNCLLNRLKTLS